MRVFILAGGLGTRLRAVVSELPKAMAPIRGKPFLQHQLEWLMAQGFGHFVLCVGYRHQAITAHFGDGGRFGARIDYSIEPEPLGTGGALRLARPWFDGDALVLNGDTLLDADLNALLACHLRAGAAASIGAVRQADTSRSGTIEFDAGGRVSAFVEKGARNSGWVSAGAYAVSPRAFDHFPEQPALSLERDVFPRMAAARGLAACPLPGGFVDIGTPESYAAVQSPSEAGG